MKKFLYFGLVAMALILAACGTDDEEQTKDELNQTANENTEEDTSNEKSSEASKNMSSDLTGELNNVLSSLEELKKVVENSPDDLKKIQTKGKTLEENWDKIEKLVEEKNPEAYNNIESSLYPLIDEVKKDRPDVVKVTQLIGETKTKIQDYKETLGT